jgi:hypothetical protein
MRRTNGTVSVVGLLARCLFFKKKLCLSVCPRDDEGVAGGCKN